MIVARKPQAMPTLRMYKVNLGGVEYTHLLSTQAVHSPRFNGELWGKVRYTTKGCWIPSSTGGYSSDKGRNATETAPSTSARRQLLWLGLSQGCQTQEMTGERTLSAAREYKASWSVNSLPPYKKQSVMIQLQGCLNGMSTCSLMILMDWRDCHSGILFFSNGWFPHCKLLENVPSYAKYPKVPKSDFFILIQIQQRNKLRTNS